MWMALMQPLCATAVGRWAAAAGQLGLETWMPREQQAPLVWLGYATVPLAFVRGIKEAESQLVQQLVHSGIVKVLGFA